MHTPSSLHLASNARAHLRVSHSECRNQRLYYRSYKAETAGQKPKVSLVFHHGYGIYCGLYDKGKRSATYLWLRLLSFDHMLMLQPSLTVLSDMHLK